MNILTTKGGFVKKILYIIKDITVVGGREKITLAKAIELSKEVYSVYICCNFFENENLLLEYPEINFINLQFDDFQPDSNRVKKKFARIAYFNKFEKLLQDILDEIQPDIMIVFCDDGLKKYCNLKTSAKKILEIHGSFDYYKNYSKKKRNFIKKIKKYFHFLFFKQVLKKFDTVIILSEMEREKWNLKNISVMPNFYIQKNKIQIPDSFKEKRFLSAGRFTHEKGFDLLIEVWKEIFSINKQIKIDIFGEGDEKEKILNMISENKLEKNIFVHSFTDKLQDNYLTSYAYILPSRLEGFSMVALESINHALPVIAFDLEGGLREMITPNKEGILIKRYDTKKMATKIIDFYNDEQLRKEMAISALKKSELFTEKKIIKKWLELFENLIKK